MKKISAYLILWLIVILLPGRLVFSQNQNVSINNDGAAPHSSAILDVTSASKGMRIPNVSLTSTSSASPVTIPVTSLLVYNSATANDVAPGYYYWDGSKNEWVRLVASADPSKNFNMVSKSATITLLKTENMVLASNDITLTLPAVTSSDNGLAITVKNAGTYTDLVSIQGNGGATIDGSVSSSLLTRWVARTFVANAGNWVIQDKIQEEKNVYYVSPYGSFTTIDEVVAFLTAHMSGPTLVKIDGGIYTVSAQQTVPTAYPVTFEGTSYGLTTISPTSGFTTNALFACGHECYFKKLNFNGTGHTSQNAINLTGSGEYYEVKDCNFEGFNKAIDITNNAEVWVFETDFKNAATSGVEVEAGTSGVTLKISECDFTSCAKGINLVSGTNGTVSVINCTFYNATGGNGITYVRSTFNPFTSIFITNNAWNNIGTFISGFDFSTDALDAKAFIEGNAGMEDKRPHMEIQVVNSAVGCTITNANTYYKPDWTNTSSYACKFTISNNRATYQPTNSRDLWMVISGNLSVNNSSRTVNFGICKNGVNTIRYGESTLRLPSSSSGQPYQFSTVVYITDVAATNYFEFFVTSSSAGDIVTVQDINWFINSQ